MRSKLFVPGSRPELFAKALASAADAVSFDLEDAVAPQRKDEARTAVAEMLAELPVGRRPAVVVRINPLNGPLAEADIEAVALAGLDVLNLPKAEDPEDIRIVAAHLARLERGRDRKRPIGILANIETPRGLRLAAEIAAADRRVVGLQLGLGDLFEPCGIDRRDAGAVRTVQLAVRLAAAEAGLPAYDGAFADVANQEGFRAEAEAARRLGYAGKSCIHPSQIALANAAFSPSTADIAKARRIVEAGKRHFAEGRGAFLLDGVMVDEPFIARARATLAQANGGQDA